MKYLDDIIPDTLMSFKEKIELAVADSRGNFSITEELDSVYEAKKYALERIDFWKNWNEVWNKNHEKQNSFERYISAQKASNVYANAVFKSISSLITDSVFIKQSGELEKDYSLFHELCFVYMCCSLKMMKEPELSLKHLIQHIKICNFPLGFYIELNTKSLTKQTFKDWLKKAD